MAYSAPPPGPARRRRTETNHQPHCPSCLARHPQSFHTSARRRTAYRSPEHPRLAGRCGISLTCRCEDVGDSDAYAPPCILIRGELNPTGLLAASRRGIARRRTSARPGAARSAAAYLDLALAAAYRRKPLRSSRGCMFAKFSNHADGLLLQWLFPPAHRIGPALLPDLVRRAGPGPAGRPAAAPRALHPVDAGHPPVQALHCIPAVLGRDRVLPDLRPAAFARRARAPPIGARRIADLGVHPPAVRALLTTARESANPCDFVLVAMLSLNASWPRCSGAPPVAGHAPGSPRHGDHRVGGLINEYRRAA